jgi:hypothetical protein
MDDTDASVLGEFQVDTQVRSVGTAPGTAPCRTNCNTLITGTPNNAGGFTYGAGHPDR